MTEKKRPVKAESHLSPEGEAVAPPELKETPPPVAHDYTIKSKVTAGRYIVNGVLVDHSGTPIKE